MQNTKFRTFLRLLSGFLLFGLLINATHAAIVIETVPVGNIGNTPDPTDGDRTSGGIQSFGRVNYQYNIGKYEVTIGQYTAFLNSVATTDTYSLYNPQMGIDVNSAGISRSGVFGSYSYSVIGSPNKPITYVSWGDAVRFANWLHNGQPTGPQNATTTERGAYTVDGALTNAALQAVTRNANASWALTSENEWYKAAYHRPASQGGDTDNYWSYPMNSNSLPFSTPPPGTSPDNTRAANFHASSVSGTGIPNTYAVTGSGVLSPTQNYLTEVGAYSSAPGPYGTFDQGGNVIEWNEGMAGGNQYRSVRGGAWDSSYNRLEKSWRDLDIYGLGNPTEEFSDLGFRVAMIPEPGSFVFVAAFCGLMLVRKKLGRSICRR